MVRALQEALQGDAAVAGGEYAPQGQGVAQVQVQAGGMGAGVGMGGEAPRWRSIRRRVVGRIRRTLPDAYGAGMVQIAEGPPVLAENVVVEPVPMPVAVAVN